MSRRCFCGKAADVILNNVPYCRWHYENYRDDVTQADAVEVIGEVLDR